MKGILSKKIDEMKIEQDAPRKYIGASSIGHQCERKIWYEINGHVGEAMTPRQRITLDLGNAVEKIAIDILRKSGFDINDCSFRFGDNEYDFYYGHNDGTIFINNETFILEIKSANNGSFNTFKNKGVKIWYPVYYSQCQKYMGDSGHKGCFIFVINKNTGEYADELIEFDEIHYQSLRYKANKIYHEKEPPHRAGKDKMFYLCKMCKFKEECHN